MTENARELLSPEKRAEIPPDVMDKIVAALSDSVSVTFLWSIVPAGLAFSLCSHDGECRNEGHIRQSCCAGRF